MSVDLEAPFPGTIAKILVKVGDIIKEDDELIILEAIKMQNPLVAPADGAIKEINVKEHKEHDEVQAGDILIVIE